MLATYGICKLRIGDATISVEDRERASWSRVGFIDTQSNCSHGRHGNEIDDMKSVVSQSAWCIAHLIQ
jgi:hypothetical protein